MSLKNKYCLITGAARGIGAEIAKTFAKSGAAGIAVVDITLEQAKKAVDTIQTEFPQTRFLPVGINVCDEKSVNEGIDFIAKEFGYIDVLVNNAGIQIISSFEDFTFDDWKRLIDVHLHGSFLTARSCMRIMQASKNKRGGSIILMGSVHSFEASAKKAAYVSAKHALLGMTRAMAKEAAKYNIKVNLIAPGFVYTDLVAKQIPEQANILGISEEDVVKKIMLGTTVDGEFTTTEEIANTVLFFASFPSLALTGQSLIVSHGWHMN